MNNTQAIETIKKLRQQGYKVYIDINRPEEIIISKTGKEITQLSPKGGSVEVRIKKDDKEIAFADSHCCELDNFCRRTGRNIGLGRCIKQMKEKGLI